MRKILLGLLVGLSVILPTVPALSQVCPAVAALPDTERRIAYAPSASTGPFSVGFSLLGDGTDYNQWLEVWLNGVRLTAVTDWQLTIPSGTLATACRPITTASVTLSVAATGTLQIVGARRPRRTSQFNETRGVAARDLNQVITDIISQNRETWDKINDVTGRALIGPPGESITVMGAASTRAGKFLYFDATGLIPQFIGGGPGSGNVTGPGSSTDNAIARFDGATGVLIQNSGVFITDANLLTVGTATPYIGTAGSAAQVTLTGPLYSSQTDPRLVIAYPTFDATNPSFYGANSVNVTWAGVGRGAAFVVQTTIETTSTPSGTGASGGGIHVGVLNKKASSDPFGLLGTIANTSDVANSEGAAVWGIVRRVGGQGTTTVDGLRSTSEVDGTDHPRAGVFVYNSTATNAYKDGVTVAAAVDYGVRVGLTTGEGAAAANVITPTHPFSFFTKAGLEPFFVDNTGAVTAPNLREKTIAARTYYVRTDGSDANTGLADTAGGAFLTVNNGLLAVSRLDFNSNTVTLQIRDGTFTTANVVRPWSGGGSLVIRGNAATPANVVINPTGSGFDISTPMPGSVTIQDMEVKGSVQGINCSAPANLTVSNIRFGSGPVNQIVSQTGCNVTAASYSIVGGATRHVQVAALGRFTCFGAGVTVTLTGTPAFTEYAKASNGGVLFSTCTYSGAATGVRYNATQNGIIDTVGAPTTYLPGNSIIGVTTQGQYL